VGQRAAHSSKQAYFPHTAVLVIRFFSADGLGQAGRVRGGSRMFAGLASPLAQRSREARRAELRDARGVWD